MSFDPFKQRPPTECKQKKILVTKKSIDLINKHARTAQDEEEKRQKRAKELQDVKEAAKNLTKALHQCSKDQEKSKIEQPRKEQNELKQIQQSESKKKRVLNLAYRKLYHDTDRVKGFKMAKNMAELLSDRKKHLNVQELEKCDAAKYDAKFQIETLRDIEMYREEVLENRRQREEEKKKIASAWIKQQNEKLKMKEEAERKHMLETYQSKNTAEDISLKEQKKVEEKKRKTKKYKEDLDDQIKTSISILQAQQRIFDTADVKAKLFNEAKAEIVQEHKQKFEDRKQERLNQRQHVADRLDNSNAKLMAKEEAILQKATNQIEEKYKEQNNLKLAKQKAARKDFETFYEDEMALRRKQVVEERKQNFRDRENILAEISCLQKAEDTKRSKRRQLEEEAQHMQLHQMAARRALKLAQVEEEAEEHARHVKGLKEEEETFQKYAELEISEAERKGLDTFAMKKASVPGIECGKGPLWKERGFIRPKYYASTWNTTDLLHLKRHAI